MPYNALDNIYKEIRSTHLVLEYADVSAQQFTEICVINGKFLKAPAKVSFYDRIVHWLTHFESASKKNLDARYIYHSAIRKTYGHSISEKIHRDRIFDINSKKPLSAREIKNVKTFLSSENALLIREKQCKRQYLLLEEYTNKIKELQAIRNEPHRSLWSYIKHPDIWQSIEKYTKIVEMIDIEDQKGLLQLGMLIGHK